MPRHDGGGVGTASMALPLSEHDHRVLVSEFNDTAAPYPSDKTIVDLFSEQVARTPDAQAISLGERSLTYRELDDRANQLAACLLDAGARPQQVVVLCMEHSIEVVCAILAVLKLGAAYVPVDPSIPPKRLAFVLREATIALSGQVPVLVTQSHLIGHLPTRSARVIIVDADFAGSASYPRAPAASISGDDLAYVIYTSGSTGTPKGVAIRHRSLVNYIWWANSQYCRREQLTWPLFSSLAFDLTVTSIFTPLVSGGRIVVYREDPDARSMAIFKVIEDGVADIVKLTPAHLTMIKDMDLSATRIRRLIVGGEDFKTELARKTTERFGRPIEIYNEYGPTEATVGCMSHRYHRDTDLTSSVPIGRPAANARVYVLDEDLNSVPPGVVGEMYLAGDGLAIGYFNRPELTANAFVTAADPRGQNYAATIPHTRSGRERLYRTGDFARWTAMGRLEFLGRKDHQVKIGGFRIELEEIEARLLAHPDVRETVVEVTNSPAAIGSDESSEPAKPVVNLLIAYYISARTLTSAELRDHLAEQLPDYMVPTYFVRLDAWPLTTNGKVDRQALPEPSQQHALRPHDDVAPRTDLERALTAMWCQLLNVERIGINDEFFELGGYSLLAMRAVSRMRDLFGVDVPLEVMFAKPTIAAVANALIEAKANRQMRGPAPTIARQTRRASGTPAR